MSENFLPIPSLNNLYEINPQGVVRNAKTKHAIQPMVSVKVGGQCVGRSVNTLLWEVYGKRRKDAYAKSIPVSVEKNGEKYFFQSYAECARFFKKVEHYELTTTKKYLGQRREIIFGWKIKYFDEPQPKVGVEHSNKGKKHRRKDLDENYSSEKRTCGKFEVCKQGLRREISNADFERNLSFGG